MHDDYLQQAIEEATRGVDLGDGGPFGAVIVRDGAVLARAHNCVTSHNDPTAHAEVMAIRAACQSLKTFSLQGAVMYASCEPCPMCLSATYWARIERIFYAASRQDAAAAGFDDARLYDELAAPPETHTLPRVCHAHPERARPFQRWLARAQRIAY